MKRSKDSLKDHVKRPVEEHTAILGRQLLRRTTTVNKRVRGHNMLEGKEPLSAQ